MYGIYGDIIDAAKRATECFDQTEELLEYPEVQADKAYYLSVLTKYNNLKFLNDRRAELISALEEEKTVSALLADASTYEESAVIYEEISALKRKASKISASLSDALGCKHLDERALCKFKFKEGSAKIGVAFSALIKSYLLGQGAKIEDEAIVTAKTGFVQEISFVAEGADVITRLSPLTGAHKVCISQAKNDELCFALTPCASVEKLAESDLKIDVFHSGGAGGQNVNKVETAIRITHLPTGLSVVCQDERSQLKNKRRALETIERRLKERTEQAEKKRIDADISAQFSKRNTPISFNAAGNTMTDTRLKAISKIALPMTDEQFAAYINGLIAL